MIRTSLQRVAFDVVSGYAFDPRDLSQIFVLSFHLNGVLWHSTIADRFSAELEVESVPNPFHGFHVVLAQDLLERSGTLTAYIANTGHQVGGVLAILETPVTPTMLPPGAVRLDGRRLSGWVAEGSDAPLALLEGDEVIASIALDGWTRLPANLHPRRTVRTFDVMLPDSYIVDRSRRIRVTTSSGHTLDGSPLEFAGVRGSNEHLARGPSLLNTPSRWQRVNWRALDNGQVALDEGGLRCALARLDELDFVFLCHEDIRLSGDAGRQLAAAFQTAPESAGIYADFAICEAGRTIPVALPGFDRIRAFVQPYWLGMVALRPSVVKPILQGATMFKRDLVSIITAAGGLRHLPVELARCEGEASWLNATLDESVGPGLQPTIGAVNQPCLGVVVFAPDNETGAVERTIGSLPCDIVTGLRVVTPSGVRDGCAKINSESFEVYRPLAARLNRARSGLNGGWILFVRAGVELDPGTTQALLRFHHASGSHVVSTGPLRNPNGRLVQAGLVLGGEAGVRPAGTGMRTGDGGYLSCLDADRECSAVSADFMMVSAQVFDDAGGFDDAVFPEAVFDVDFCLRQKSNQRVVAFVAEATALEVRPYIRCLAPHHLFEIERLRLRWPSAMRDDPHYSPRLVLDPPFLSVASFPVSGNARIAAVGPPQQLPRFLVKGHDVVR